MINIKVQKKVNNAIASINNLYNDYVLTNPNVLKGYLIIKINYDFNKSIVDNQRKIKIKDIDSFYLEEIDFSKGHKQDKRNWSSQFNPNSGRLIINNKDIRLDEKDIDYQTTLRFLKKIVNHN